MYASLLSHIHENTWEVGRIAGLHWGTKRQGGPLQLLVMKIRAAQGEEEKSTNDQPEESQPPTCFLWKEMEI